MTQGFLFFKFLDIPYLSGLYGLVSFLYEAGNKSVPSTKMVSWLIAWAPCPETQCLKEAPHSQSLQQLLKDWERDYKNFSRSVQHFRASKNVGKTMHSATTRREAGAGQQSYIVAKAVEEYGLTVTARAIQAGRSLLRKGIYTESCRGSMRSILANRPCFPPQMIVLLSLHDMFVLKPHDRFLKILITVQTPHFCSDTVAQSY